MLFFIQKDLFLSHYVWQRFQCCLIYNKMGEKGIKPDKAKKTIPCSDIFFFVDVIWLPQLSVDVLLYCFSLRWNYFKGFRFFSFLPQLSQNFSQHEQWNSSLVCLFLLPHPLTYSPADISSYGCGRCQFSGAAGIDPSYQSGHICAEACGGAAPTVGDPARLLLCPSGEGWYQIIGINMPAWKLWKH